MANKYLDLAAKAIRKPGTTPPRLLFYGRAKIGKTRLACSAPNLLVIDPEFGTEAETGDNPDVWDVGSWDAINDVYHTLKTPGFVSPATKRTYEWVAFDGLSKMHMYALRFVTGLSAERKLDSKPGKITQPEWGQAGELMSGLIYNLMSLPYGLIFTAQERMVVYQGAESDDDADALNGFLAPDLPNKARIAVCSQVSLIGRMYTAPVEKSFRQKSTGEVVTRTTTERRLWVAPSVNCEAGFRTPTKGAPSFLANPTVPKVVEMMKGTAT